LKKGFARQEHKLNDLHIETHPGIGTLPRKISMSFDPEKNICGHAWDMMVFIKSFYGHLISGMTLTGAEM
jgi:hypothetical protein